MNESTPLFLNTDKSKKKPSPYYIITPLLFLTFTFSALYAPMIQFYTLIYCHRYYNVDDLNIEIPFEKCIVPEVQSLVSEAQAVIMFLTYISTLLFASYYGSLSDRKGRRLVLQISTFGNILLVSSYIVTFYYQHIFGTSLLYIIPFIRGLLAGDTVLLTTAQAYITDCTVPSTRTLAFSHMMSSLFIGATLGPSIGSMLLKETSSILSIFYVTLTTNILFLLYVFLILPESNNSKKYTTSSDSSTEQSFLQRMNVFSALGILAKTVSPHTNQYALLIVAAIQFLLNLVALPPSLLYAMLKFNWTAYEGGFYVSLVGFARLVTTMIVLPLIAKLFSHRPAAEHDTTEKKDDDDDDDTSSSLCQQTMFQEPSTSAPCACFDKSSQKQEATTTSSVCIQMEIQSEYEIKYAIVFDSWLIRAGLSFETACFIATALVTTSFGFTMASVIHALSFLSTPSVRSLLTTLVDPSDVGKLLGATAVLEAIAMIISQLSMNSIYSATVKSMPELVFYFCAIVSGLGLILSFFVYPTKKTNTVIPA